MLHQPPPPKCLVATEFDETNQVKLPSMAGLWIILAAAIAIASAVAAAQYLISRAQGGRRQKDIEARASHYVRAMSMHLPTVTHAASAFAAAGSARRARRASGLSDIELPEPPPKGGKLTPPCYASCQPPLLAVHHAVRAVPA